MKINTPIFWRADTSIMWLLVAVASFWFGVLCMIPSQTMVQAHYKHALALMPQSAWGLLFISHFVASLIHVFFYRPRFFSCFAAALGLLLWFMLTGAVLNTLHSWMPAAGEFALCGCCMFLLIRALTDE